MEERSLCKGDWRPDGEKERESERRECARAGWNARWWVRVREKRRPQNARGARCEREKKRDSVRGTVFVIKGATRGAEESQPHQAAHQSGTVRCPECTSIFRRVSLPRCHVIPRQRSPRKPRERVRSPVWYRLPTPKYLDASAVDRQSMRDGEIERFIGFSRKFYRETHGYRSLEKSVQKD